MTDILNRVQQARKQALATFFKEKTIHELAVFIRDTHVSIETAISADLTINASDLNDPDQKWTIIEDKLPELFELAERGATSRGVFKASLHNPHLKKQYELLTDHFKKANKAIDSGSNLDAKAKGKERAERVKLHMDNIFHEAVVRSRKMLLRIERELEDGEAWQPEVLVLQGGGAKGMAYSGVIEHLQDNGMLKGIKRVAGTSAGAMLGLAVAVGCSSEEINDIVHNSRFAQFFAESTRKFRALIRVKEAFSSGDKVSPFTEGLLLGRFSSEYFLPALCQATKTNPKDWRTLSEHALQFKLRLLESGKDLVSSMSLKEIVDQAIIRFKYDMKAEGEEKEADQLKFTSLLGRSSDMQCALNCLRLSRSNGIEDGDIIEAFIGDLLQMKLEKIPVSVLRAVNPPIKTLEDIRSINFDQFKQLGQLWPEAGLKEFGVAVTDSYVPLTPKNALRFGGRIAEKHIAGENSRYSDSRFFQPVMVRAPGPDLSYIDMPIKNAVRCSMNLPFLFPAIKMGNMRLVDGGLTNNFPHRIFSDYYDSNEEADRNMIGFMLSTIESDIELKSLREIVRAGGPALHIEMEREKNDDFLCLRKIYEWVSSPIQNTKQSAKSAISSAAEIAIERLMDSNITTLPSLEAMENVGIINTGRVDTADFHLPLADRRKLHHAGNLAAMSVTGINADKDLRYAMGRLISLATIESALLREKGEHTHLNEPLYKINDPDSLAVALSAKKYAEWELSDILLGRPVLESEDSLTL